MVSFKERALKCRIMKYIEAAGATSVCRLFNFLLPRWNFSTVELTSLRAGKRERREGEKEREKDGRKMEVKKNRPFKLFLRGRLLHRGCFQLRIEWQHWELLKSAVYHRVLRDGCVSSRTTEARHMKTHPSPSLAEGHGAALPAKAPVNSHFTLKHNLM